MEEMGMESVAIATVDAWKLVVDDGRTLDTRNVNAAWIVAAQELERQRFGSGMVVA